MIVTGDPIAQGSKTMRTQTTASGRTSARMYDANPRLRQWRAHTRVHTEHAMEAQGWQALKDVPVRVTLTFTLAPSLVQARQILKAPGTWPAWRGYDIDKLTRAVLDSLTDAGAIDDDSRVASLLARKLWAGSKGAMREPGVVIEVREHWRE